MLPADSGDLLGVLFISFLPRAPSVDSSYERIIFRSRISPALEDKRGLCVSQSNRQVKNQLIPTQRLPLNRQ